MNWHELADLMATRAEAFQEEWLRRAAKSGRGSTLWAAAQAAVILGSGAMASGTGLGGRGADGPGEFSPVPLRDLSGVAPRHGAVSVEPAARWEYAFVTGNGRMGAMMFGDPAEERLIANHCRLYLPLGSREIVPDLASHLPELRRVIREEGYGRAMEFFLGKAREQVFPGLTWTDPFHPGFEVILRQTVQGVARDYARTEDFETGEVRVRWRDDRGLFERRLFVSRPNNLIVWLVTGPGSGQVNCELVFPPVGHADIESEQRVGPEWVTYHNIYRKGKGGYDAIVWIAPRLGTVDYDGKGVRVSGADELMLLMRIVPWKVPVPRERGEAWAYSPDNPDFAEGSRGVCRSVPVLGESSVVAYGSAEEAGVLLDRMRDSVEYMSEDYRELFQSHAPVHRELFNRVTLDLGGGADRAKTTEELLETAARSGRLPPALLEKMFDAGRYMFICSSGELPPNLQGIWTGTWRPAWSGDFTTDTNLELAMKHVFSGNLVELVEGYLRLVEAAAPDWRLNARRYFGCRGLLAPTRMSNHGLMLHWGTWDGIWWTAGASWMVRWFPEHYRYTGDRGSLAKRALPLLREVVQFYEDFMSTNTATGRYEFIPSYSPESSDGITATMDVMAAKDTLLSLIEACEALGIEEGNVPWWKLMLEKMPPYRVNRDGALAEWVPPNYGEHYRHRHLSHLHAAYEATGDLSPESDPALWRAAQEATRRRIQADGEQSSHGRMHMGLAAAYLGLGEEAYGRLEIMATRKSMYPSLITSHEPDQQIFNTDANGAIPEIVNRMLVSSWPGRLDLLPALPQALPRGEIRGLLARGQIRLDRLTWDKPGGRLELDLTSRVEQDIALRVPGALRLDVVKVVDGAARVEEIAGWANARKLVLPAGQRVRLEMAFEGVAGR